MSRCGLIKVRKAKTKDKSAILDLLVELGRPAPNKSQKALYLKLIQNYISDKQILVACDKDKIVGMASVVFIPRLNHTTPELWIPELVVSGRYRNKGIGKKLMSSCQKLAKKKKCFRIRLESGNQRKAAQRFYRKIGFDNVAVTLTKKP